MELFIRTQETVRSSTNRLVLSDDKFLNQSFYVNLMTVETKGQGYIRKQETDLLQIGLLSLIINF